MSRRSLLIALLAAALVAAAFVVRSTGDRARTPVDVVEVDSSGDDGAAGAVADLAEPASTSAVRAADRVPAEPGVARRSERANGPRARDVTIEIVALEHGTRRPVAGARAWIVDADYQEKICDASGRATFRAVPDMTLLGVHPPDGSSFLAFQNDPVTKLPSAQDEVTTRAGQRIEIPLVLHRGATVRGLLLGPDGSPRPGGRFVHVPWNDDRYDEAVEVVADDDGRFELLGLAPGPHMLGSSSRQLAGFLPNLRLDLDWGETRELELRLSPWKEVELTVRVTQEGTGEPWPFPFRVAVTRTGPLPGRGDPKRRGSAFSWVGTSPLAHTIALSPGQLELVAGRVITQGNSRLYLTRGWSRKFEITIDDGLEPKEVELTAPAVPHLAHLEVRVNGDFTDASRYLTVRYSGGDWDASHPVEARPNDSRFDVWADLDDLSTGEIEVVERGNGFEAILAKVTLLEGEQSVTVTPSPR